METTADKVQAEIDTNEYADADRCPECGYFMKEEAIITQGGHIQRTWECGKCGNTETE